jgi:hypothetical protein
MSKKFGRFLRQNTIALLALFLVLGGTSYAAASAINGKSIKPNSIPKNRLTKTAIKQLHGARGARGPQGAAGAQGVAGPKGATGAQGVQGVAGTARAYGLVNAAGTTATRSKGVVAVTHPNTGQYCLQLDGSITAASTGVVVSPDFFTDSTLGTNIAHAEFNSNNFCGAGNYLAVMTFEVTANGTNLVNTATDQGFFFIVP